MQLCLYKKGHLAIGYGVEQAITGNVYHIDCSSQVFFGR